MMSNKLRALFMAMMSLALFFGFFHHFQFRNAPYDFDRLHIFLFNLCSGGSIILFFTQKRAEATLRVRLFICLSLGYALFAFFKVYPPAVLLAFILAGIVESIRIEHFSLFPVNFFQSRVPVYEKFHQASLLCLSIGLVMSGCVIVNNEYLKLVSFPKLTLNTFFLGFSFPLSLITFSEIFALMKDDAGDMANILKNIGFWFINLGVIIFFVFILFEKPAMELVVSTILFLTVVMVFRMFLTLGVKVQQKKFLLSGISFLVFGAVTGIIYIVLGFFPEAYTPETSGFIMRLHTFSSLYGWNLSGLAMICRHGAFPIQLNSTAAVAFHWGTVIILAPLGMYYPWAAVAAVFCYTGFLYILFSREPTHLSISNNGTAAG